MSIAGEGEGGGYNPNSPVFPEAPQRLFTLSNESRSERQFKEENSEETSFDLNNPPYDDPAKFLEFLRWYHSEKRFDDATEREDYKNRTDVFDYDILQINSDMVSKAIAVARKKNLDPRDLSPAQIIGFAEAGLEEKEAAYVDFQRRQAGWEKKLKDNFAIIKDILLPHQPTLLHSTSEWSAQSILKQGLYVGKRPGLLHTAVKLYSINTNDLSGEALVEAERITLEHNLNTITNPHKGLYGNTFVVVIRLPELKKEQKEELKEKRERGEGADTTDNEDYYNKNDQGEYFLNPKYIVGCINLDTGELKK